MAWIIASVPFWLLGGLFALGAFASIEWRKPTSDAEVGRVFGGLILAGAFFAIAAWVAS